MSKKLIITILAVAVLAVGGFFVVTSILQLQRQQTYDASSDKVADDTVRALLDQDVKALRAHFSTFLLADYSESYWNTRLLPIFAEHKDWPTRHFKGPVQPASPDQPNRYDPELNQQATLYQYDFRLNNVTYRLNIVVFRQNNAWKVNELSGDYRT